MNLKEYTELGRSTANLLKKAIENSEKDIDVYLDEQQAEQASFTAGLVQYVTQAGSRAEQQLQLMELETKTSQDKIRNDFNNIEMGADVSDSLTNVNSALVEQTKEANDKVSKEINALTAEISRIEAIYEFGCISTAEIIVNELPVDPIGMDAMEQDFMAELSTIMKTIQELEKEHAAYTEKLAKAIESGAPAEDIAYIQGKLAENTAQRDSAHAEMHQREAEFQAMRDAWRSDNEILLEVVENRKQDHFTFEFMGSFAK